jgi:hypothetical protein
MVEHFIYQVSMIKGYDCLKEYSSCVFSTATAAENFLKETAEREKQELKKKLSEAGYGDTVVIGKHAECTFDKNGAVDKEYVSRFTAESQEINASFTIWMTMDVIDKAEFAKNEVTAHGLRELIESEAEAGIGKKILWPGEGSDEDL